jgi:hypothetical protein
MSATNYMLKHISQDLETRSNPSNPDLMQSREHRTVERYKITDEGFVELTGNITSENIIYYVGSVERQASPPSGKQWICTSSRAAESARGVNWRQIDEVWEAWTDWVGFTPP